MLEAIIQGVLAVFSLHTLPLVFIGVIIGLIFGVTPGLSGMVALAILLPVIFGMEPAAALAFLLAAHSVIYAGGSISAILFNIPGAPPNAATVIDGFPMTQQGKAGQAVGASLTACMVGSIVGAVVLAMLMPVMRAVVMSFGSPEVFFMAILGIVFISVLGTGNMMKGLISGGLGIFLSFVGYQSLTGIPRFSFGSLYLYDGFGIIPLALGLFAIPEIIDLAAKGGTIAKVEKGMVKVGIGDMFEGIKAVFRHWWLTLRSAVIGAVIGIIPGAGGDIASFVAYGQAKQTSKDHQSFGKGNIKGVIAPEGSNDAKEGGSLVPTLALGVPGSSAMAILLGGFLLLGIEPGPTFLKEHMDLAFTMVMTVAFAGVLSAVFGLPLANQLTRLTFVRGHIVAPIILVFVAVGAFSVQNRFLDVVMVLVFGALGYAMKAFDYNRPALILGFVLGALAETYFHISLDAVGPLFFLRPISSALLVIIILALFSDQIRKLPGKVRKRA